MAPLPTLLTYRHPLTKTSPFGASKTCALITTRANAHIPSAGTSTIVPSVANATTPGKSAMQPVETKPCELPTPVNPHRLAVYLDGYSPALLQHLIDGFTLGFRIPSTITSNPPKSNYTNHPSALQQSHIVTSKINKELELKRISGPHHKPLPNMVISPLGLVPKKEPGHYRLIHDLSFPTK